MKMNNVNRKRIILTLACLNAFCVVVNADETPKDSTKAVQKEIYQWSYNATHTKRFRENIDTSQTFFYLHEPNGSIADYLVDVAGYGSPAFSLLYQPRANEPFSLRAYEHSLVTVHDIPEYTVQRPYSQLYYSGGLNSEQSGRFLHTQNINKYCNVGFNLNFYRNIGEYENQGIVGQHVTPWITYYGPRFTTTFKYAYNNIRRGENGGIAADSLLYNENLLRMKFPKAESSLRYQDAQFVQKWNLGRKPKEDSASLEIPQYKNAIGYRLDYYSVKRNYSDITPDTSFYTNVLYDSTATADTSIYKNMSNALFYEFIRKNNAVEVVANVAVGLEYQSLMYHDYNYSIPEYLENSKFYQGTFDVSLPWNISASHKHRYVFAGDAKKDFTIATELEKEFSVGEHAISIKAGHKYAHEGSHWSYLNYETNNYAWHNDFAAENKNDVYAFVSSSYGNVSADIHYYTLKNYVAFDNTGTLSQTSKAGNALTINLKKTTNFKYMVMQNGVLFQDVAIANQEYPNWATYNSVAFRWTMYKKLLHFTFGGELLYYPSYNVPTYDGAIGDFIPQSQYNYGGFPFVNAFATVRYKPVKVFVKYSGLYALLKGENYPIASYPQSNGTISFGLSWLFYN